MAGIRMKNFIPKKSQNISRFFLQLLFLLILFVKKYFDISSVQSDRKQVFRESVNDRATAQNRNQLHREDGSSKMARVRGLFSAWYISVRRISRPFTANSVSAGLWNRPDQAHTLPPCHENRVQLEETIIGVSRDFPFQSCYPAKFVTDR